MSNLDPWICNYSRSLRGFNDKEATIFCSRPLTHLQRLAIYAKSTWRFIARLVLSRHDKAPRLKYLFGCVYDGRMAS